MKEKFEIKPLEQKPKEKEPETPPEVETWEGEGGAVETQEETSAEVPETVVEEPRVERSWREILIQAKDEFPEEIKELVEKSQRGEKLKTGDFNRLDAFSQHWFRETFGVALKKKQPISNKPLPKEEIARRKKQSEKDKEKPREKKIQPQLQELFRQKRNKMEQLHRALKNLDAGESVEEFIDETRRVAYFDEQDRQYFVEKNGKRYNVGIGDIISDYAWGIKYFPDSGMTDATAYRTLAKRILTNETRRDLEKIHNSELQLRYPALSPIESQVNKLLKLEEIPNSKLGPLVGGIAEIEVRELLNRVSTNHELNIVVMRADIQEDAQYKYDFKIRVKHKNRGVRVEGSDSRPLTKIGFQLKTHFSQATEITSGKYIKGRPISVEEVIFVFISTVEFLESFQKWLSEGRPSGGPEQFLSPELKKAILKAVTEKFVDIPQEVFDKIE